MKINHTLSLLIFVLLISFQESHSQKKLFTLEKNNNVLAKDLVHTLNKTKDSLLLRSNHKIHYIYSINSRNQREINQFIEEHEIMIPLASLSSGKHVMAVSVLQKKILFVVWVHDPSDTYIKRTRPTQVATRYN